MQYDDLKDVLEVEESAMKGFPGYIKDAFDYYKASKGELSVVLLDGKIIGVGKMSVLFDGSAWLEALRVHSDYQQRGAGAAIYKRYFEQVEAYDCPHVALYTGRKNIGSQKLGRRHGLETDTFYTSFTVDSHHIDTSVDFTLADEVPELLIPTPHFNINHTFYRNNEANLRGFLSQGYIYTYKDTTLIMGSRFQPKRALYIAHIEGSYIKEALEFAISNAHKKGIKKVIIHYPTDHILYSDLLTELGFVKDEGEDMVMTYIRKS